MQKREEREKADAWWMDDGTRTFLFKCMQLESSAVLTVDRDNHEHMTCRQVRAAQGGPAAMCSECSSIGRQGPRDAARLSRCRCHSTCSWCCTGMLTLNTFVRFAAGGAAASACGRVLAALHERLRRCAALQACSAPQQTANRLVSGTAPVLGLWQAA